jgi:YHS domain-containing protein
MVRFLLFLLLLYFVLRAVGRLVRGIREGMLGPIDTQPPAVPLVRDPVCGTYVVPSRALTAGEGSDIRFFCSEKCRRAYRGKPGR